MNAAAARLKRSLSPAKNEIELRYRLRLSLRGSTASRGLPVKEAKSDGLAISRLFGAGNA